MALLLGSATGAVANADGVGGPAWVLFLPIVVVAGAVLGPMLGLLAGAGAAGSLYAAAAWSHTLDTAGLGKLVVLLPAFPAIGWAAGALAAAAHDAATEARARRAALEHDVGRLTDLLEAVADGDLSTVPALDGTADAATASLAVAFSDTLLSLRRLVRQLGGVSEQLAVSSTELAATATHHVGAVEQQASAVAETTRTIEELATTATTIAETSVRVATCAGSTRRDVDSGAAAVAQTTAAMTAIGERVGELDQRAGRLDDQVILIGEATRRIDELARQTTMLAVNAAIEAARSGDTGVGFATVAEEVATLAERARSATAGITRIVSELHAEVAATARVSAEGSAAVRHGLGEQRQVEAALTRISDMVDETTTAARDITLATRQQRSASTAVVTAMQRVTTASNRARSATKVHAGSAERLRDLAESVRAGVGRFRVE
jgi:methyl-accepting chemotaxis protein